MESIDWSDQVYDEKGNLLSLIERLPTRWTLLVFLRHAECIECNLLVNELNHLQSHLRQWGINVIGISNGDLPTLHRLRQRLNIDPSIALFSHPSLELHKKLKLHKGILRTWGLKAILSVCKAVQKGYMQSKIQSPVGQQSGLVLLTPHQEITWIHRSEHLGDIPSSGVILEQLLLNRMDEEEH